MKKIMIALFVGAILLTGCSSKEVVVCQEDEMKMEFVSKSGKIQTVTLSYEEDMGVKVSDEALSLAKKGLESQYDEVQGITLSVTAKDTVLTVSVTIDISKVNDLPEDFYWLKEAALDSKTVKELVEELKEEGISCSVK